MSKYFKPHSLTWWSAMVPLAGGLIMATEPMHGLTSVAQSIHNASGMTAPALINLGVAGIGLRGAIK